MLQYFCRKKRGSITIFLTIIMAAIISSSSTLVEMGKYHSEQALFQEMTDHAAFSTLAHYDTDLYSQYGLFAMDTSVGADVYKGYLSANMNLANETAGVIGKEMTLGSVEFNPLYPLSNDAVLKYQIQEFSKYRGPLFMANEGLDLEEKLTEFIKALEEKQPMLGKIEEQTGKMEDFTDVAVSVKDFADELMGLKDLYGDYKSCVEAFNSAIGALGELDELDENYEQKKADAISHINSCGESLKNAIDNTVSKKQAILDSYEKVKEDMAAFKESVSSEDATSGKAPDQETYYQQSDTTTDTTIDKVNSTMEGVEESDIISFYETLDGQKDEIGTGEEATTIEAEDLFLSETSIDDLYAQVSDYSNQVVTEFNNYIKQIKGLISISKALINGGKRANPDLNNTMPITDAVNQNDISYSAFLENDLEQLRQQIDDLQNIMGEGGSVIVTDEDALILAMSEFADSLDKLQTALDDFPTGKINLGTINKLFKQMKKVAGASLEFIQSMNGLVQAFIVAGPQGIAKSLYSVLMLDTYATSMFSTRITDIENDTNMAGNPFPDKLTEGTTTGWFDKADVEYIFAGKASEEANQKIVYNFLFGLRFLFNIIPVLNDTLVKSVRQALGMVPYIGAFLSIIVLVLWIVVESYVDMQVLINLRDDVPMLKGDHIFLSPKGIPELIGMIENRTDELAEEFDVNMDDLKGMVSGFENKTDSGETELPAVGNGGQNQNQSFLNGNLLPMNYREYLVFALFFCGTNNLVKRTGNLIEADMRRVKGDEAYRLSTSYTYVRVKTEAQYKPVLPVLTIPGVNSQGIPVGALDYCGY